MWPCRKKAAAAASSEGRLEAATSHNPFGKTDASAIATADEPDIQAEATAMAILAAERLAYLLDFNAERSGPKAGLKVSAVKSPVDCHHDTDPHGHAAPLHVAVIPLCMVAVNCC